MDKISKIIINDNKQLEVDNIIKVKSFNTEEFVLETTTGPLIIQGEGLEMDSINTSNNKSCIKGIFYKIIFHEVDKKKKKDENFIKKLLK